MSVELYALFSYAFTAAIALVMIGAVVLLNKIMGSSNDEGGMEYQWTEISLHNYSLALHL